MLTLSPRLSGKARSMGVKTSTPEALKGSSPFYLLINPSFRGGGRFKIKILQEPREG